MLILMGRRSVPAVSVSGDAVADTACSGAAGSELVPPWAIQGRTVGEKNTRETEQAIPQDSILTWGLPDLDPPASVVSACLRTKQSGWRRDWG